MTILADIFWFAAGMGLCVQWVAAWFGIVDCRYAGRRLYPRVAIRILSWTAVLAAAAWLAGGHRPAFGWGMGAFVVLHAAAHVTIKGFMMIRARLL